MSKIAPSGWPAQLRGRCDRCNAEDISDDNGNGWWQTTASLIIRQATAQTCMRDIWTGKYDVIYCRGIEINKVGG